METPSSTRRVTRSQSKVASSNGSNSSSVSRMIEDSEKNLSKTKQRNAQQQDRCALVDISNDSPIVGLANGDLGTPLSSIAKQRGSRVKKTPGSGEALLRGQVKTLLQKVEEEAEISKLSMEIRPFLQLVNSPMSLLAPTPANTPQIPNFSAQESLNNSALVSMTVSSVVEEQLISQVVNQMFDGKKEEESESEKNVITRSLLLDFSDKSEVSECSSEVTYQEVTTHVVDDAASVWSIQVNASTHDEEEDDDEEEDYYFQDGEGEEEEEEEYYEDGGLLLDELCEGLNSISVNEKGPHFTGKHKRFVYNSDDELVEEVEVENSAEEEGKSDSSSDVLRLKGLPTPEGKHIRFSEEEEKSAI